jgi:hypothetical protein
LLIPASTPVPPFFPAITGYVVPHQSPARAIPFITLKPGLHRFADLASMLTQAGIPVRCDKRIASRLVLLRLEPRPWNQLSPLLEAGLGIRFRESRQETLTLEEDPTQTQYERQLLSQLERVYGGSLRKAIRDAITVQKQFAGLNGEALQRAQQSLQMGTPEQQAQYAAYRILYSSSSMGSQVALLRLNNGASVTRLLDAPLTFTTTTAQLDQYAAAGEMPYEKFWTDAVQRMKRFSQSHPPEAVAPFTEALTRALATENLFLDAFTLSLTGTFDFIVPDNPSPVAYSSFGTHTITTNTLPPPFTLLDLQPNADLKKLFAERQATTEQWLKRAEASGANATNSPAATPITPTTSTFSLAPPERSVSAAVWQWSAKNMRQLIMEVPSTRDVLPLGLTQQGAVSLAASLDAFVSTQQPAAPLPPGTYATPPALQAERIEQDRAADVASMLPVVRTARSWTIKEMSAVVIVRNEWQFIDHRKNADTSTAVRLWHTRQQRENKTLSLADLAAATEDITAEQMAEHLYSSVYEDTSGFVRAFPYLQVLRQQGNLPTLLPRLQSERNVSIAYADLTPQMQQRFIRDVQTLVQGTGARLIPGGIARRLPENMERGQINIRLTPYPGKEGLYRIVFSTDVPLTDSTASNPAQTYPYWRIATGPLALQ